MPPVRRGGDPVVRWLTWIIFLVIIVWLAAIVSAMVFGVFRLSGAPRTAAERDLDYYDSLVASGKATSQVYAQYVDTLIRAGQLTKAQQSLDSATKIAKNDKSYLYAEQAQLYLAEKNYQATVQSAAQAMTEANNELRAFMKANVAANRKASAGATIPDSYPTAALAQASAYAALKDFPNAVKSYDAYLKVEPTDSDVLVARGYAKAQTGDNTGAANDYRDALKYIPDYQPAIDGLKQIGATR